MRSHVDRLFWKAEQVKLICRCGWSMPIWQPQSTLHSPTEFFVWRSQPSKGLPMNLGLKDCKAFIAGASKGLGKACAKALADEGARVFICARNKDEIEQAASEFGAAGYSSADVSLPADVKRVMAEAVTALGGLDCLVTNAGGPPTASFEKAGDDDWDT